MTGSHGSRARRTLLALSAAALAIALGGCAADSVNTETPVGIGAGVNALKRSPCACIILPNLARG